MRRDSELEAMYFTVEGIHFGMNPDVLGECANREKLSERNDCADISHRAHT